MLGMDSNASGDGQADFCPFSYSQDTRMMSFWSLYPSCKNIVLLLLLKMSLPLVCYMLRMWQWSPVRRRQTNRFSSSVHEHGKWSRGQWESRVPGAYCCCSRSKKSRWWSYGSSLLTAALEAGDDCSGSTLDYAQCTSIWKCTVCVICLFSLVNIPNEPVNWNAHKWECIKTIAV